MSNISTSFKSISHPIRVQILLMLAERINAGYNFSELSRELQIESSGKLAFHLEKMEDLIQQSDSGEYNLTEKGKKAVQAIQILGVQSSDPDLHVNNIKITDDASVEREDIPIQVMEGDGLKLGQFMLIGYLIELLIVFILPIGFSVILSLLAGNFDAFIISLLVFMGIGSILYGVLITKLADKKGGPEVNKDFGLVLFLLGTWPSLIFMSIVGTISFASLLILLSYTVYFLILPSAWISIQLFEFKTDKTVFPLEFYHKNSKYMIIGIVLAIIPFVSRMFVITDQPDEYTTVTNGFGVSSSEIGMIGISTLLFVVSVLLLFRNSKSVRKVLDGKGIYIILALFVTIPIIRNLSSSLFKTVWEQNSSNGEFWLFIIIGKAISSFIGGIVGIRIVKSHLPDLTKS